MNLKTVYKLLLFLAVVILCRFNIASADNTNVGVSYTIVNEHLLSPASGSTTSTYGALSGGTYTSSIQNLSGFTRLKGFIITDAVAPTVTYINQIAGGTNTSVWHGTDTINYVQVDSIFRGEVDVPIWGRLGRLTLGGFGTATFASINVYISNEAIRETAVKWVERVVTVGTTTLQLAPQSSSRKYLLIVNDGASNDVYISGTSSINTAIAGTPVVKNFGYWSDDEGVYYNAIYGVTITGTTSVRVMELK